MEVEQLVDILVDKLAKAKARIHCVSTCTSAVLSFGVLTCSKVFASASVLLSVLKAVSLRQLACQPKF